MKKTVRVQIEDRIYNATLENISEGMKTGVEFFIAGEKHRFWCKGLRRMSLNEEFTVLGTKLRVVYFNGDFDIVQYDRYVSTQLPYTGMPKLNVWSILCLIGCLALPILTLGGKLPILTCAVACIIIHDVHKSPFYVGKKKILITLCVLGILYLVNLYFAGEFALLTKVLLK